MLSAIRRRFTYANVALTLALVFAMSGGAYAASRYLITSTKQISPKVLSALRGKAGPKGPAGPVGPAGPAGAQGAAGSTGLQGTPGVNGKEGPEGKQGAKGENGTTGFTATLPSGKTETGYWAFDSAGASGTASFASMSFAIPLEVAPEHSFFVTTQEIKDREEGLGEPEAPAACPGTVEAPAAKPGNLCAYEGDVSGLFLELIGPTGSPGAGISGGALEFYGEVNGEPSASSGFGTWAVTAH